MTSETNADDYDENSVFNRLFAKETKAPDANSKSPLERIFGESKPPVETIDVADFLPRY